METTTLGALPIGSSVSLPFNSGLKEFIVVHHGKPSANYDDSFNDSTVLMMKSLFSSRAWGTNNSYQNSAIHTYLNGEFLQNINPGLVPDIKDVKIPYRPGSGGSDTVNNGANGLSTKAFLASYWEVGYTIVMVTDPLEQYVPYDGAKFDYFPANNPTGSQTEPTRAVGSRWWMRTPSIAANSGAGITNIPLVESGGQWGSHATPTSSVGVRPFLVLPKTQLIFVGERTTVNLPPTQPKFNATPTYAPGNENLTLSWTAATSQTSTVTGYILERLTHGGTWTQIYDGASLTYDDFVTSAWTAVQYRVRAYDAFGYVSDWTTSALIGVDAIAPSTEHGMYVFETYGIFIPQPGKTYKIICIGAGAGGGAVASGSGPGAGGGASGVVKTAVITFDTAEPIPVTVGLGGPGGAPGANKGSNGGASSFGTRLTSPGGEGGNNGGSGSGIGGNGGNSGGNGGPAGAGTYASDGSGENAGRGGTGIANYGGGAGGGGGFGIGKGASGGAASANGRSGAGGGGYGGGGGGSGATNANNAGGDGAPGAVIIMW